MLANFKRTAKIAVTGVIAGTAIAASAAASAATYELTEAQKRQIVALLTTPKAAPGIGIGVPTGFGAQAGQVFASIGGITTKKTSTLEDGLDGAATLGMGFGDADEFVGLEVQANVISLTNNAPGSDFGEEGSVSVKLSRNVGSRSAVSVGAEDVATWGDSLNGTKASGYVAFTTIKALSDNPMNPLTLSVTLGAGTQRFQDLDAGVRDSDIGLFGSLSLAVHRQVSLIAEHNGNFANAGISVVPLRNYPLVVTLSAINVNEVSTNNGGTETGDSEFGGSIGYSWNF